MTKPVSAQEAEIPLHGNDSEAVPYGGVPAGEQPGPGGDGVGEENQELAWARRHVKDDPAPEPEAEPGIPPVKEVFRKTELHTIPPDTGSEDLKKLMNQMMKRLKSRDPEILYLQYETSYREFICSLLVRQYREEREHRKQVAALWEQIGLLDDRLEHSIDRVERLVHETAARRRS
jgi:hypothetical protein